MLDLIRSLRDAGDPVPVPWPSLGRLVRPRRGTVGTVLGAPGTGKSTMILEWLDEAQVPSLYISLDTSLGDQAVRYVARRENVPVDVVETWPAARMIEVLEKIDAPVRFFARSIHLQGLGEVVAAETEYWGEAPAIVVVDNMKNLIEKEESQPEYERIIGELHKIARDHNVFVLALHHVIRPKRDDREKVRSRPITMTEGMFAGERDVSFVFGLWRPQDSHLKVAILKNRMGRDAPDGSLYTTLDFDGATARVTEMDQTAAWIATQGAKA